MAKFIVKQTPTGYKFDLRNENGVIATSEVYTTESACKNGVESVKNSAAGAVENQTVENYEVQKHPKFEIYEDKAGAYRYRLKARNGEIIATCGSLSYKTVDEVIALVSEIKETAAAAAVDTLLTE